MQAQLFSCDSEVDARLVIDRRRSTIVERVSG